MNRTKSFKPISYSSACQVVGCKLDCYFVAGENSDKVHADFSGDVCKDFVTVFEFDLKHGVWEGFKDFAFDFDNVLFRHVL